MAGIFLIHRHPLGMARVQLSLPEYIALLPLKSYGTEFNKKLRFHVNC